jgi:hypothetical protein
MLNHALHKPQTVFSSLLSPFPAGLRGQKEDFFGRIYISAKRITIFLSGYIKHAEGNDKAKDKITAGTSRK